MHEWQEKFRNCMKKSDKILLMSPVLVNSEEEMLTFGREVGRLLEGEQSLALVGDLGAGKTHFVKGLAQGLGSEETVTSPTFPLVHEYCGGRLPLYHFDFYRLDSVQELLGIGWDDYVDAGGVMAIEWANKFISWLPEDILWIHFAVLSDTERRITILQSLPAEDF